MVGSSYKAAEPPLGGFVKFSILGVLICGAWLFGMVMVVAGPMACNPVVRNGTSTCTGLEWNTFGLHPILMTLAFGLLAPVAITSYRGLERWFGVSHATAKSIHTVLLTAATLCGTLGFWDMWLVHGGSATWAAGKHFVSIHSFMGFAALLAFGLQWASGFGVFCMMGGGVRKSWMPSHKLLGGFALLGTLASIATGMLTMEGRDPPGGPPSDAQMKMKWASLLVLAVCFFVLSVLRSTPAPLASSSVQQQYNQQHAGLLPSSAGTYAT